MEDQIKQINQLIEKAAKAERPDDEMKFAQAALNAANVIIGLRMSEKAS